MKKNSAGRRYFQLGWIIVSLLSTVILFSPLSYAQSLINNQDQASSVITQSTREWKRVAQAINMQPDPAVAQGHNEQSSGGRVMTMLPPAPFPGAVRIPPGQGYQPPFGPAAGAGRNLPGMGVRNPGPQGEPTGTSSIETLLAAYSRAIDQESARSILDKIVDLTKTDSTLKTTVAEEFSLSGVAAQIWEDFNILIVSSRSGQDFTEAQLQEIYSVLK